jgi:hypothetical protein
MMMPNSCLLWISLLLISQFLAARSSPLAEQFKKAGYVELCDKNHGPATFDVLYARFDELIEFLQTNPAWAHKLYHAKERFMVFEPPDTRFCLIYV